MSEKLKTRYWHAMEDDDGHIKGFFFCDNKDELREKTGRRRKYTRKGKDMGYLTRTGLLRSFSETIPTPCPFCGRVNGGICMSSKCLSNQKRTD